MQDNGIERECMLPVHLVYKDQLLIHRDVAIEIWRANFRTTYDVQQ